MSSKRQPEWKLEITKAHNGYVLRHLEELTDDYQTISTEVIEEDDSLTGERDAALKLCYALLSHFGVFKGIRIEAIDEEET